MQHHQQVDPQGLDQLGPGAERRQADGGGVRLEEAAGVGLEGEHPLGRAQFAGQAPGLADYLLMAAVDAVEASDGDDRALQVVGDVLDVAQDLHCHESALRRHSEMASEATRATPAACISSRAAAKEPSRSMARQASSMTVARKPSSRASSADHLTQKSVARPQR